MNRGQYIRQQRDEHGRKCVLAFPIHYPRELFSALNVLAVEIWGPPAFPKGPAGAHLQPFICSIAHNALAFLLAGKADMVDAILFPHTCDSLQMLASVVPDFGLKDKPCFRFRHPKGAGGESARRFYRDELAALLDELRPLFGQTDDQRLWQAIELHVRADTLKRELLQKRAHLETDDGAFYELLRAGEYLWVEDHIKRLSEALSRCAAAPVEKRAPILLSGIVPEPRELLDVINRAGAYVAADDTAAVGRRVPQQAPDRNQPPLDALTQSFFSRPSCTTLGASQERRISDVLALARNSGAKGALLYNVKFCEPEAFYAPALEAALKAAGLPALYLETELEGSLSGQAETRLEAFVEMLQ